MADTLNVSVPGFIPKSAMTPALDSSPSRFLMLPSELRLRIFSYCFDTVNLGSVHRHGILFGYHGGMKTLAHNSLRLATLCRTVTEEVIEAFYSTGTIILKVEWAEYFSQTKQLLLPPGHVRRFVRRIAFYNSTENFWHSAVGYGHSLAPLQRLEELGFRHLKAVEIVIGESTADIINFCFQEPRKERAKQERLNETLKAFRGLRVRAGKVSILGLEQQPEFKNLLEQAITLYR